jgi:hypothetical protein
MRPQELLREYFNLRLSSEEVRAQLAEDKSREARMAMEILNVERDCQQALKDFGPPEGAPERLAEKVVGPESWVRMRSQEPGKLHWRGPLFNLMPACDVVGHAKRTKTVKSRRKSSAKSTKRRLPGEKDSE